MTRTIRTLALALIMATCGAALADRAAVIHSDYSYGGYTPGSAWDAALEQLGYEVAHLSSAGMPTWRRHLDRYDLVFFTAAYTGDPAAARVDWSGLGDDLSSYLRGGGVVVMEGARSDYAPVSWLKDVNPGWSLSASRRLSGLPEWIDPALLDPHRLPDGLLVRGHDVGRAPGPAAPDYANGGVVGYARGQVLASNRYQRATVWTDTLGQGRLFATTYFNGYGLDELLLEDLLAWHHRRRGQPYAARLAEAPGIARRLEEWGPLQGRSPVDVAFDRCGVMQIDGEPFVPHGFYCVKASSFPLMAENGFNFSYNHDASAAAAGLRTLTGALAWDVSGARQEMEASVGDGALVAWELVQEPSNSSVTSRDVQYAAAVARQLDPSRPVALACNNPAAFEGYVEAADLVILDPYCIWGPTSPLTRIARDIGAARQITRGKPVWVILQAHWFSAGLALPTPAQLRAEMYVALAAGAKGITWFALDDNGYDRSITFLRYADGRAQEPQWSTLCQLADEFGQIESYLAGADDAVQVTVVRPGDGVFALCFTRDESPRHLLVVANALASEQSVRLTWPLAGEPVRLFDSPDLRVLTDGHMEGWLGGYERGVYVFE